MAPVSWAKPAGHFFWNKVANKILVFVTHIPYNNILTDMGTGCKLFNREVVTSLNLKSKGFGIEPELTARLLKRGVPIVEAPIRLNPRLYSEGNKIKAIGAFTASWTLVKYRLVD